MPPLEHSAILCLSKTDPLAALSWLDRFALREEFKAYDRVKGTIR